MPDIPPPSYAEVRKAEENSNAARYADEQARLRKKEQEERERAIAAEARRKASETSQNR